jgi:hypothetical protein
MLNPWLLITARPLAEVVFAVVNAQVGNFVALLSERITEATENNHCNPGYPEIPQPS